MSTRRTRSGLRPAVMLSLTAALVPLPLLAARSKVGEPSVIVVRNDSPRDLRRVELSQHGASAGSAVRLGSVSPVPRGVEQSVARSSSAPRLPKRVEIRWTAGDGQEFSEVVDLGRVLAKSAADPGGRLVVRIGPGNDLSVYVEAGPEGSSP